MAAQSTSDDGDLLSGADNRSEKDKAGKSGKGASSVFWMCYISK